VYRQSGASGSNARRARVRLAPRCVNLPFRLPVSEPHDNTTDPDAAMAPEQVAEQAAAADGLGFAQAAKKVRGFPQTPGVYLMKDAAGRVIYIGKAKNLRARAGSYFLQAAGVERRTAELVREIADIEFLEAESEVDALLMES